MLSQTTQWLPIASYLACREGSSEPQLNLSKNTNKHVSQIFFYISDILAKKSESTPPEELSDYPLLG